MKRNGRPPIVSDAVERAVREAPSSKLGELHAIVGGKRRSLVTVIGRLLKGGIVFAAGQRSHRRYFSSAELAAAYAAADTAEAKAERRAEMHRRRARRIYAAEKSARPPCAPKPIKFKPAKPPRPPKPVKAAKPPRAPTSLLTRAKATPFNPDAPKRGTGPALLDLPADESKAVRIVASRTPGRFEVPADYRGAFSLVGIGRDAMTGRAWSAV